MKHLPFGSEALKRGIHGYEEMFRGYGHVLTDEAYTDSQTDSQPM